MSNAITQENIFRRSLRIASVNEAWRAFTPSEKRMILHNLAGTPLMGAYILLQKYAIEERNILSDIMADIQRPLGQDTARGR